METVIVRYYNGRYVVEELQNRMTPLVGSSITPDAVADLIEEAKSSKNLWVVIR